ncbi:MAG: arylsulfatase [Planctomyces sp.]|nr:arylsulfatase [Planctomyces sp.]
MMHVRAITQPLLILWALGLTFPNLALRAEDSSAPRQPSFVILLCDDLGYGDLGCYGHPHIKSPHLDRLASTGLLLTDCYSAAPVCSPSRCGLLTGRSPHRLGIHDWIPPGSPIHLERDELTIPALLRPHGYKTAIFGKWHANGLFNNPAQPQPGDFGFGTWMATQNNAAPSHLNPVNFVRNGTNMGKLEGHASDIVVDAACDWLSKLDASAPFVLFVTFHAPHEPVATSPEFTAMYKDVAANDDEATYFGNVTQTDAAIGRLLGTLEALNREKETLVFFTSDNGPERLKRYKGSERSYGRATPLRGQKLDVYEGGYRVPGILRYPPLIAPGTVSKAPVCGVDLLPTICEMAGVDTPADRPLDGASLIPMFKGELIQRPHPLYWRYARATSKPWTVTIRENDWKLVTDSRFEQTLLFNLADDKTESLDISEKSPDVTDRLLTEAKRLFVEMEADAPQWPPGKGVLSETEK